MQVIETKLKEVKIIEPKVWEDERGFFMETWNLKAFEDIGIGHSFVQDNHSRSSQGVLRGLHYQWKQPQAKLLRVTAGEIFDVAVDIRRGSPTFGKIDCFELSAANKRMLYVPEGFAHGFFTVSESAELQYKCSDLYCPENEHTVLWNDEDLEIPWPLQGISPIISAKDIKGIRLKEMHPENLPEYHGESR